MCRSLGAVPARLCSDGDPVEFDNTAAGVDEGFDKPDSCEALARRVADYEELDVAVSQRNEDWPVETQKERGAAR